MADRPIDVYLNDHLGGAMLGSDLAEQIRDQSEGTPLGETMSRVAEEIEEDRETLLGLMDALGTERNPVKQVTGWLAEKASRVKFSGAGLGRARPGDADGAREPAAGRRRQEVPVAGAARDTNRA